MLSIIFSTFVLLKILKITGCIYFFIRRSQIKPPEIMKNLTKKILLILLFFPLFFKAQSPSLGLLENYSIFANGSIITNERVIIMEGEIGVKDSLNGNIIHVNPITEDDHPTWSQLTQDITTLQNDLNNLTGVEHSGIFNNESINPGTYDISGNAIVSGRIHLNGDSNDVFVFNVANNLILEDFTLFSSYEVNPKNVYWNVGGTVTGGINADLMGFFVSNNDINLNNHNSGSVTLISKNGDIRLSTLLNLQSPNVHRSVINRPDASFTTDPSEAAPPPDQVCNMISNAPFFDPESWMIDTNFNEDAPLIEIGVNFHILSNNNGTANFQQNTNDTLSLLQNFDWAKSIIRHPRAPTKPQTAVCGSCHIRDSRIQLVLKSIEYYQDNAIKNTTSPTTALQNAILNRNPDAINDLNVIWTLGLDGSASGKANFPLTLHGSNNNFFQWIIMFNRYSLNKFDPNKKYQGHFATAITIAHEVGHNLALRHTYSGGVGGANCNTSGLRYLEDVHGPASNNICPHAPGSLWGCNALNPANLHCTNNVMSGNKNALYLSPKQLGIAHLSLRFTSMRQKINNCPYSETPLVVSSDETWDKDMFIYRDVVVESGATLTISCRLGLPYQAKIKVEKNARLIIDGGILTNSCKGEFWQGIRLVGDHTKDQLPLNHPIHQAKVELKNGALIENARNGISTWDPGNYSTAGSLIAAKDATFKNCFRAVEFLAHDEIDQSFFRNCDFILNSNYTKVSNDTTNAASQVTLWKVKGVQFRGCTFKNNSGIHLFEDNVGNGIFSIDANYSIDTACLSSTTPCPTGDIVQSSFTNFNHGVFASNSASQNTISIDQSEFYDNSMGLRIEALNNVRFTRNNVITGGVLKDGFDILFDYQKGFFSFESSGYRVEGNTFESRTNPVMNTAGVYVEKSGMVSNEIYRNDFKDNTVGEFYKGKNKDYSKYQGLQFLCNTNSVANEQDVIVRDEGIRTYQGISAVSAGNVFSNPPGLSSAHIENLAQPITYHYGVSQEEPTSISGPITKKVTTALFGCPTRPMGISVSGGTSTFPSNAINSYYIDRGNYNNLLYNYFQQIDNGNTDSLQQAIGLYFPSQAQQLRDDLISQSPYLSTQALMDAASTGVLADALLLEVALANPDATQSEGLLDFLEFEIPNPLPSSMIQLIYQSWGDETPRTLLENDLADYNAKLGWLSNQILQFYQMSNTNYHDSIVNLIESRNTLQSKYHLAELAIEENDFIEAFDQLNEISTNFSLNTDQINEHLNFTDYVTFRQNIVSAGKNYLQLTSGDQEFTDLQTIASNKTGRSSTLAQNILCFGYGQCRLDESDPPTRMKRRSKRIYDMEKTTNVEENIQPKVNVNIQPNPATEEIQLTIHGMEKDEQILFRLISMKGQQLMEERMSSNSKRINVAHLKKGSYIYQVIRENEESFSGSLIIQ